MNRFPLALRPYAIITGFLLLLSFLLVSNPCLAQQEPVLVSEPIYTEAAFPSCHASTVAITPVGPVAAWFGGTREKDPDVEIYLSRRVDSQWTSPISVANGVKDESTRYPCWNPVLFQVPAGPLLLFYKVGPSPQSWWGEMKTSEDHGVTWSQAHRLPDGILGPIKNKPVLLDDGRLLCPTSVEFQKDGQDFWQVFIESTSDLGKTWQRSKALCDGLKVQAIQPSILTYPNGKLQLLCRSRQDHLMSCWSTDSGKTWQAMEPTFIPNPNSGTDAVTLTNGHQLLVYNPTTTVEGKWGGPRSPLSVAVSHDGKQWQKVLDLETQPGEYSYPAVVQAQDGRVHITYTYQRKTIQYVVLDPNKLPIPATPEKSQQ